MNPNCPISTSQNGIKKIAKLKWSKIGSDELLMERKEKLVRVRKEKRSLSVEHGRTSLQALCMFDDPTLEPEDIVDGLLNNGDADEVDAVPNLDRMFYFKLEYLKALKEILARELESFSKPFFQIGKTSTISVSRPENSPSIVTQLCESNVFPKLAELLTETIMSKGSHLGNKLQQELVSVLAAAASVSVQKELYVMWKAGIHRPLGIIVSQDSENAQLLTDALRCLCLLCSCDELREFLVSNEFFHVLLKHFECAARISQNSAYVEYTRVVSWALFIVISSSKNALSSVVENEQIVVQLISLMKTILEQCKDPETVGNVLNVAYVLSSAEKSRFLDALVENHEMIGLAVTSTNKDNQQIKEKLTSAVNFLACLSSTKALDCILGYGFLTNVNHLLDSAWVDQRQVVIILSNVVNAGKVSEIIRFGIPGKLADIISYANNETQKQMAFFYRNLILKAAPEEVAHFVQKNVVYDCSILLCSQDPEVLMTMLQIYGTWLSMGDKGLLNVPVLQQCLSSSVYHQLKHLMSNQNPHINAAASYLVTMFFHGVDTMETSESVGTYDTDGWA